MRRNIGNSQLCHIIRWNYWYESTGIKMLNGKVILCQRSFFVGKMHFDKKLLAKYVVSEYHFGPPKPSKQPNHVPLKREYNCWKCRKKCAWMKLKLVFVDEEWIAMPRAHIHETSKQLHKFIYSLCSWLFCKIFCLFDLFAARCCSFLELLLNGIKRGNENNCNSCFAIENIPTKAIIMANQQESYELWLGFRTCHFVSKLFWLSK